jgi:hypothetical protein
MTSVKAKIALCFLLLSGCKQLSTKNNVNLMQSDEGAKAIYSFYTKYIEENLRNDFSQERELSIKKKHCTSSFLESLDKKFLEVDPFLNVQDYANEWVHNLTVVKVDSFYKVCVHISDNNTKHCVHVFIIEENGKYLIDNVLW